MKKLMLTGAVVIGTFLVGFSSGEAVEESASPYRFRSYKYYGRSELSGKTRVLTLQEIRERALERLKNDPKYQLRQKLEEVQAVKPNIKRGISDTHKRRAVGGFVKSDQPEEFDSGTKPSIQERRRQLGHYFRDTAARRRFYLEVNRQDHEGDEARRARKQVQLHLHKNRKKDLRLGEE